MEEALSASKDLLSVLTTYNTSSQSRETILNFVSKQKIIETKLTNFIKALDHSRNLGHHIQASAVLSCFSFSMLTECSYEDYTMLTDTVIALIKNSLGFTS